MRPTDCLALVSKSEFVNYAFGLFQKQENFNTQQFALITIRNTTISSDPNEVKNMMRSNVSLSSAQLKQLIAMGTFA